ncbi:MAG: iron-containing alcohol dehydrogenase [Pseudotabrizicola sp.]|uniref:iron-containing alcohol dehydrogenase n=1 Tax=Pseudotabrizicola sp. TaxID=2939647 RepID=UPI0027247D08|nr:iron-containing alcohol dehydrogenase [Pseudotabrizicola sp.]MDO8885220.1 iron-containing alcohol dehydrogenase [Pseudotabrizicola sp.]MDP2082471.1 iron-containing alcohol dehydrogenase [Pseudotabrizicola sp.]MDZ7572777.1 iron-containing alcohol dehydrogenase [Pseudotabrizicola sp.]
MTDYARPLRIHQPRRVEVGAGSAAEVGAWAAAQGYSRILVLTQKPMLGNLDRLALRGDVTVCDQVHPEPDTDNLDLVLAAARLADPELVIGFGGGSVMDLAKLVTVLRGDQTLSDVVGPNKVTARQSALALVPTTAGTGSEAGIRALVTDAATLNKMAVESPLLLADMVALDPDLTLSVPSAVTAATGIDAMAHCVEAFTNRKAHPMIDGYARMGISLVARYLPRAVADGNDAEARAGLLLAAYYGGICLGPVNTAAGHALAYPLGTRLKLPHGVANAIIFPHVLAFNQPVATDKTAEIAELLSLNSQNLLVDACDWCAGLGVSMRLSEHGATAADLPKWAAEAHAIRRLMDNNPRDMSVEQVEAIYREAF